MENIKNLKPKDIEELRKRTKKLLKQVPEGKRVNLGKEFTEALLFDERMVDVDTERFKGRRNAKFLVWSGKFLRKLDLSEVSFDDVVWDIDYYNDGENEYSPDTPDYYRDVDEIVLCNTNARIDFSQSFDSKIARSLPFRDWTVYISYCDFTNVDLSNNILETNVYYDLESCDFGNTGLKIDFDNLTRFYKEVEPEREIDTDSVIYFARNCDFSGLDFRRYTVSAQFIDAHPDSDDYCNFSGTGLRISTRDDENREEWDEIDDRMFERGYLLGCYVDGKKIGNGMEPTTFDSYDRAKYEQFKNETFNNLEQTINDQIKRL